MLLAYYGDDFTGSTDVLEVLTTSGVTTVLFTEPPNAEQLARFPNAEAIGIAGDSRTMSPAKMDAALPAAFAALVEQQPSVLHYKVCSTFDSSPTIGNIGRAIELGRAVCQNRVTPVVVGSPNLQRFCLFGNLFARSGLDSPVHRLDRHPTMSRHPATPMTEADLRRHLAEQTPLPVALVDLTTLDRGLEAVEAAIADEASEILLYDTLTSAHLATIGASIWNAHGREGKPLFVAGSSGIESALVAHWKTQGIVPSEIKGFVSPRPVGAALMISGSCSPVTARQIDGAIAHGAADVPLDTPGLLNSSQLGADVRSTADEIVKHFAAGRSVVVHTSRGPDDPRIAASKQTADSGLNAASLGDILGRILALVLASGQVGRVAVAGGDTSGAIARTIGIEALEMIGPLAPGAPLCVTHSQNSAVTGVEFTFKGGQVGHDDFFGDLLRGGPKI
jgi:uncharacterized protein YgbK (DUF1537 family)